jgi:Rps23 Pro-64 3,4-dihydroxylase Tpa1-like proline 4-hydroxylase
MKLRPKKSNMKIQHYNEPFPYIIVDDYYDAKELESIWEELRFLCNPNKLGNKTAAAFDDDKNNLKSNVGVFLESIYKESCHSNILTSLFKITDIYHDVFNTHPSWFFHYPSLTSNGCLLSYYEDGGYYKRHYDVSAITMCAWFYEEPRKFTGGDLTFSDYDLTCELKNNRVVFFPSQIYHEVAPVRMKHSNMGKKLGRFCVTTFFNPA